MDGSAMQTVNGTGVIIKTTYGSHTVMAYARDLCGNKGVSDPFTITLKKPESLPHASLSFPDIFGAPSLTPNSIEQTNPSSATLQPSSTNTNNQQTQQGSFPIITIIASAVLIAFVVFTCLWLFKRRHKRQTRVNF
jgi:hypothetical protein